MEFNLLFKRQVMFEVGPTSAGIALGDLNRDGHLDIVSSDGDISTVSVLIGDGKGSFSPRQFFGARLSVSGAFGITLGDLNQDGYLDIVYSNYGDSRFPGKTVSVLIGDGKGSFAPHRAFEVGSRPWGIALGDLNQDGYLDVVSSNSGDNTVSVLIADGKGSFAPRQTFAVGVQPWGIALGDLNRDGYLDIVNSNYASHTVSVLIADGKAGFAPHQTFAVGVNPRDIALGDLNQDGHLDIVNCNQGSHTVSVLFADGKGSFAPHQTFAVGVQPWGIALGDLNRDGHLDIVNSNYLKSQTISILISNGNGNFAPHQTFAVGLSPRGIALGDLNEDGHLDIANSNYGATKTFSNPAAVSVLLGNPDAYTRTSTLSLSPTFTPIHTPTATFSPRITLTQSSPTRSERFIDPTRSERFIDLQKAIFLAIGGGAAIATLIGSYAKRGLLKNILHASHCWTGNPYIKEEAWTPENKREMRELRNRHDAPIAMRNIGGLHLFTVSDKDTTSSCITPNYYARRAQAELLDQELVTTHPIFDKAWIKLNPSLLDEVELDTFFIQVFAKDGEVLEEFSCSLEQLNQHHRAFDLDITGSHTVLESQDESVELDLKSEPSRQTAYSYHARIEWSNPFLQDPQWLQIAYRSAGIQGIDRLIEIGASPTQYIQFARLEQSIGTEKTIEAMLLGQERHTQAAGPHSSNQVASINLFWAGIIAYRLPAAYDQVQYLLKSAGFDLQVFYEDQGIEGWTNSLGSILRPSLLLGGATMAYYSSSDPLVLLVAANQPGFSADSDSLSDGIHYLTTILSFASVYAHPSPYTLPLMAIQSTHLLSQVLVDTGYIAKDNGWVQFMQSATGLTSQALGLMLYPDLPVKVLQSIGVLAQGMLCAELSWENISPYLPYAEVDEVSGTNETDQTMESQPAFLSDLAF